MLLVVATPVYAIENPDSISVESIRVFEGLWETGDMLFVVEYKVMFASDPEEDPQDTFSLGIWNESLVKGPDRPLDYYDHNFSSIYLTAAQVTSFGYALDDELKVRVYGNPAYFPVLTEGVNMSTTTLSSQWINAGSLEDTREYLALWSIILAGVLEDSWGLTLLTSGGRLNAAGMVKFKEAIPGLDTICPEIFQVSSSYPDYTDPTYDPTFEVTLLTNVGPRLEAALEALGLWVTGKNSMGGLIGGVGLAVLFFVLAGRIFVATGSVPTSIVVSIPFLFVGNIIGILSLTLTFVAAFIVIVLFGVTFILGRV